MMNHTQAVFGGEQRKWGGVLISLLVLLFIIHTVSANLVWTHETGNAAFGNRTEWGVSVYSGGFYPSSGDVWLNIPMSGELWESSDGVTWSLLSADFPTDESIGTPILEFNGEYYAFHKNDVFNSSDDGATWNAVTYTTGYPNTRHPAVAVKGGEMYVWGGYYSGILRGCYSSPNGTTWSTVTSDVGYDMWGGAYGYFAPYFYYIGGYGDPRDIYYSSDGATWTLINDALPVDVYAGTPIMEYDGYYYIITSDACEWGDPYGVVLRSSDLTTWEVIDDGNGGDPAWYSDYEIYNKYAVYSLNGNLYVAGGRGYIGPEEEPAFNSYTAEIWSAPISSPSPPDPGPDNKYLYWRLVKDGFAHSSSIVGQLVEHNGILFLMTSPNGVMYENPSGNPYSGWYTVYTTSNPVDPFEPSGLTFPAVIEFNNTIWVLGGTQRPNYTWQSNEYVSWVNPGLTTWDIRCTTSWNPSGDVGGAFLDFNGYLWRIGSNEETQVYRTVLGDTWELVSSSLPFTWASVYANDTYMFALEANESGNNNFYRSTSGSSWTLLSNNSTQYKYAPDNVFKNIVEWDGKLWVVGGGSEATYYSRNGGYDWHMDREYCEEYPEIDHTSMAIVYDASGSTPEMIYSYSFWTGELWAGAYFPVAEFSATPLSGVEPLTVTFTDASINMGSGVGTRSWLWSFGDGETSTSQNPSHTYTYPGEFTVSLSATNMYGSDTETKVSYVTVGDIAGVAITGEVINAIDNSTIPDADIAFLQYGTYYNTTSDGDGEYEYGYVFAKYESINTDTAKAGYTSFPTNFMVLANGSYTYNLYMIPEFEVGPADAWVGGFVYDDVWAQGVPNATVNIWNGTWSDTNTTNAAGFYLFTNLTNTSYSFNATALNFDNSLSYNTTPVYGNFTQLDIPVSPNYALDLVFKNADTYGIVYDNVSYVLSNATNGSILFQNSTITGIFSTGLIDYGLYNFTASCEGYYPYFAEIYLYSNVSSEVFLDPIAEFDGANTNYVPHPVRFTYVDAYGNPITGATVTATALESTNPWSWLEGVFGFSSTVDIEGTVLSGTTGSDGTLSFLMVETIQYRVHCVKTTAGIDHTVDIYPKESEYFIRIGSLPSVGSNYPIYSLNATTVGSNVVLFGNYSDTSGSTSAVYFVVLNSTGSEVYNASMVLTGGVGSESFAVNNTKGEQYREGIVAFHSTEGTIEKWIDVTLKGSGRLIDFGDGWTDFMYIVMALACIFMVAGCFGEMDVKLGAVLVPVIGGGLFEFIGWLPSYYGVFISVAGFLGVLYYMRSKMSELDK